MEYYFPVIHNISQILKELKQEDYSIVNEDEFCIVNSNSVDSSLLREIRGLAFDLTGKIIARPYHQAFTLDQSFETQYDKIVKKLKGLNVFLEKLDGTLIYPVPTPYGYRLTTKKGIKEESLNAEVFIANKVQYNEFINICLSKSCTPIFEWCSLKNKIVIEYSEENLVLTGLRNIKTGVYCKYRFLRKLANNLKIPVVNKECVDYYDIETYINNVKTQKEKEGIVVKFDSGHMFYIKSEEYLEKRS
jgi:RNA ligase